LVHDAGQGGALPHILSFCIEGLDAEAIMVATKSLVAISNGSACTSARYEPSHVLKAMDLPAEEIAGTVRISWGHDTPRPPWRELAEMLASLRF